MGKENAEGRADSCNKNQRVFSEPNRTGFPFQKRRQPLLQLQKRPRCELGTGRRRAAERSISEVPGSKCAHTHAHTETHPPTPTPAPTPPHTHARTRARVYTAWMCACARLCACVNSHMLPLSASAQWHRCLPPPRSPPDSPPLLVAFVWRVLWVCVCMSVCVFGFQTNFLEFLPLLCVSPHVTSPAVAEAEAAAAAAVAPGIGLEQESR